MKLLSFIIDTNVLIEIEKNNKLVLSKIENLDIAKDNIYITSPSYSEFYLGLLGFSKEKIARQKDRLDRYKILNTSKNSSRILAEIKKSLSDKGIMIPIFDLFIGSIAIDSQLPLITTDRHFSRIPNLRSILIV